MPTRLLPCLALLVAMLATPSAAHGALFDRVPVGVAGVKATRGFSPSLSVVLNAPDGYTRGCCYDSRAGQWAGPRWQASSDPAVSDASHVEWNVVYVRTSRSASALARSAGWAGYPEAAKGKKQVLHLVGGRKVGTLKAFHAFDAQQTPGAAAQEALVIDLSNRVKAVVLFNLGDPAVDEDPGLGRFTVNGLVASAWNRRQAAAVLEGVSIDGSLPPARIKARAGGRRVKGTVVDGFGHPVADAQVELRTTSGRKVATGRASKRGAFALAAPKAGTYRVGASFGGPTIRSAKIRVP